MITQIHIQNYKLFKSLKLENLPQFALIGGKNNSGKTSLLEAVFLLLDCMNPAIFLRLIGFRGLNIINTKSLFTTHYHNLDISQVLKFDYKLNNLQKKLEYRIVPDFRKPLFVTEDKKDPLNITQGNIIDLKKNSFDTDTPHKIEIRYGTGNNPNKAFLQSDPGGLQLTDKNQGLKTYNKGIRASFLPIGSFDFTAQNSSLYGELDKENKTRSIVEALKILDPSLKSLSVIPEGKNPVIYADTGFGKKIPLALAGQSMNRLLSILLSISNTKNGIVLVDEIENGFHHSVMSDIWRVVTAYAAQCKTQLIATTHSREFTAKAVEAVEKSADEGAAPGFKGLKDSFKYIRIDRQGDEFTPVCYDFESLKTALSEGFEIR